MTKIFNVFILGLIFASAALAHEEEEVISKPTLLWHYKSGKTQGQIRMAQESAPGEEFEYRRIMWIRDGKYPELATIVKITDDTYRAIYRIDRPGGKAAEDWQLILSTGKAYEDMLVSIRSPEFRKSRGMKENTCPKQANAIWTAHDKVTQKTQSYCLIPAVAKGPLGQTLPSPSGK
jgi:hypothetical protein